MKAVTPYTSEHVSLAAWEKIVHVTSFENFPEKPVTGQN